MRYYWMHFEFKIFSEAHHRLDRRDAPIVDRLPNELSQPGFGRGSGVFFQCVPYIGEAPSGQWFFSGSWTNPETGIHPKCEREPHGSVHGPDRETCFGQSIVFHAGRRSLKSTTPWPDRSGV